MNLAYDFLRFKPNLSLFTPFICLFALTCFRCQAQQKPIRVACVGTSITSGFGLTSYKDTYPYKLQQKLGSNFKVGNFGRAGATATQTMETSYYFGLSEMDKALHFSPDVVVFEIGTNDARSPIYDPFRENFKRDCVFMIQQFQQLLPNRPKIYIVNPAPVYDDNKYDLKSSVLENEIRPQVLLVAKELGLKVIPFNEVLDNASLFFDNVHPTAQGASKLSEVVFKQFVNDYPDLIAK